MARKKSYGPFNYERQLGSRNYNLEADFDKIILNTERKMLAVAQDSLQAVVEDMQTPVAKGGKMRLDTGFLRSTGLGSLEAPPSGPERGDKKEPNSYTWTGDAIGVILSRMKLGDTFYFGWTANYAKYREAYDGFLESALQNWQTYVSAATEKVRKRFDK